jgi:hypothetical protein
MPRLWMADMCALSRNAGQEGPGPNAWRYGHTWWSTWTEKWRSKQEADIGRHEEPCPIISKRGGSQ